MTKRELIDLVSKKAHLTKKGASEAINVLIEEIFKALEKREKVLISGFGTFKAVRVNDKPVTIPGTRERRLVKSHWTPKFTPSKPLKQLLRR